MKKLIGILGMTGVAMVLLFNTGTNDIDSTDLASLIAINTANAELTVIVNDCDDATPWDTCSNNNNFPGCDNSLFWDTCERIIEDPIY